MTRDEIKKHLNLTEIAELPKKRTVGEEQAGRVNAPPDGWTYSPTTVASRAGMGPGVGIAFSRGKFDGQVDPTSPGLRVESSPLLVGNLRGS